MTRRKKKQRGRRWWINLGVSQGRYTSSKPWCGLKRRVGKNEILPGRWSTQYTANPAKKLVEPQVRTPVGKRRERRAPGKPR